MMIKTENRSCIPSVRRWKTAEYPTIAGGDNRSRSASTPKACKANAALAQLPVHLSQLTGAYQSTIEFIRIVRLVSSIGTSVCSHQASVRITKGVSDE